MNKLIPIILLLISVSSFAQGGKKMNERIRAQKIAFITEKLDLSSKEAQGFWPIYNEFVDKVDEIRSKDLRAIKQKMRENRELSEKEADELLDKLLKAEGDVHAAKLKLVKDLKKVISSEKIIRLKAAEDEFNKKLLKKLREFRDKSRNR